ncbi:Fanconi-associated nuclease 1 [Bulinus truncatus]|nr:Fanconi-associated nuclease 1 [Bulinus truncatus]
MMPKKKTKLSKSPGIQMNSIASLFQKQNEKLQVRIKSAQEFELDDDLQITKVETVSPYFKNNLMVDNSTKCNPSQNSNAKKRKLSLFKPATIKKCESDELECNASIQQKKSIVPILQTSEILNEQSSSDSSLVEAANLMTSKDIVLKCKLQEISVELQNTTNNKSNKEDNYTISKDSYPKNVTDNEDHGIFTDSGVSSTSVEDVVLNAPYYLNNFESILNSVMSDLSNKYLFNAEDMTVISSYQTLTDSAKKLFIRMFSRKPNWIPVSKLNYPEIADDLTPFLEELQKTGFIDSDEHLNDLEQVLLSLSAADIKMLAKSYHVTTNVSQKRQLVNELIKVSQRSSISTLFGCKSGDIAKEMLIKAKLFLKAIFKLKSECRKVFVRVMMLFSLVNTSVDDDAGISGQAQLFQLLLVNIGKLVYPSYTVDKVHNIFSDRDDVIRFEQALQLESDLLNCIQRSQWDKAYEVFKCAEEQWIRLLSDEQIERWNKDLPDYLRTFTATSVITRLMSMGIDILQRRKDFNTAVQLLQKLLSQTVYNTSHRGYWWERLALNLDAHLKKPKQSLDIIADGLADKYVIGGHRLALFLRAESICQRGKLKLQDRIAEFHHDPVKELPKVFIEGRVLHDGVSTNGTKFLTDESYADGNSQDITVCGVEVLCFGLDCKKNGFTSGVHAEGSLVSTLFGLFFWDIIFMPLPDAFHSPFQALPLDFCYDAFYERRKTAIETKLKHLADSSVEELQSMAEEIWQHHEGSQCIGVSWERLRSVEAIKAIHLHAR